MSTKEAHFWDPSLIFWMVRIRLSPRPSEATLLWRHLMGPCRPMTRKSRDGSCCPPTVLLKPVWKSVYTGSWHLGSCTWVIQNLSILQRFTFRTWSKIYTWLYTSQTISRVLYSICDINKLFRKKEFKTTTTQKRVTQNDERLKATSSNAMWRAGPAQTSHDLWQCILIKSRSGGRGGGILNSQNAHEP